jgi:hypothetical protein
MRAKSNPGDPVSPSLANSYGLELGATEHQQHPPPQATVDNGASAPQVVDEDVPYAEAHGITEKYAAYPHIQPLDPSGQPPKEKILGLSKKVFWIVLVLVLLVVLGVGLGSGLAVGLKHGNKSSATTQTLPLPTPVATTTRPSDAGQTNSRDPSTQASNPSVSASSTSTLSAPVTSGTTGVAANSCNFTLPKTYYAPSGTGFTQYCFTDWPNDSPAADGRGNITDLSRAIVYTFEDCMQECLDYNERLAEGRTRCTAVTYNANLTSIVAVGRQGGNCFLKDKRAVNEQGSAESACAALAN